MPSKKICFLTKEQIHNWVFIAKMLVKSKVLESEAVNQFNRLSAGQRASVRNAYNALDEKKKDILEPSDTYSWEIISFVDAHIIAAEYEIDPAVVLMCVNPKCLPNQQIYMKR